MNLLEQIQGKDINACVQLYEQTPGAVLLDARRREEYAAGHIPGSRNLPLQEFAQAEEVLPDRNAPVFVYCLSGARSRRMVMGLQRMGYAQAVNIGGISDWKGLQES